MSGTLAIASQGDSASYLLLSNLLQGFNGSFFLSKVAFFVGLPRKDMIYRRYVRLPNSAARSPILVWKSKRQLGSARPTPSPEFVVYWHTDGPDLALMHRTKLFVYRLLPSPGIDGLISCKGRPFKVDEAAHATLQTSLPNRNYAEAITVPEMKKWFQQQGARKRAIKHLVNSWQERLQLISVITTFFASAEVAFMLNGYKLVETTKGELMAKEKPGTTGFWSFFRVKDIEQGLQASDKSGQLRHERGLDAPNTSSDSHAIAVD
ncbi:hypothetical protein V8B97DRAFT_1917541 [Scleroderma yunnanense]